MTYSGFLGCPSFYHTSWVQIKLKGKNLIPYWTGLIFMSRALYGYFHGYPKISMDISDKSD
jgi:hypothetical protein